MLPRFLLASLAAVAPLLAGTGQGEVPPPGAFRPGPPPPEVKLTLLSVATGLEQPIYVTSAPAESRLYIVERTGRIRILENGALRPEPFLDLRHAVDWDGERGLLGLAFAPDYATTGRFYIAFTEKVSFHTVVVRLHAEPKSAQADLSRWDEIIRVPQTSGRIDHKSGWIGFRPGEPDCLYVATGDGGDHNDPDNAAQNLQDRRGKILKVKVSGEGPGFTVPAGNPFAIRLDALPEIWAYGLRNPYRCSFDRATGDLFLGDVGQDTREEIDYEAFGTPGGRNYGWRPYEGRFRNTQLPEPPAPVSLTEDGTPPPLTETYIPPLIDYAHQELMFMRGCVIGGYVYRGTAIPHLRGHYVFGDFTNARVYSLLPSAGGTEVTQLTDWTVQLNKVGEQVAYKGLASFGEDAAGELYVVDFAGTVLKIVPEK